MSETSAAVCRNCDRPIVLLYGTWIHVGRENSAFAGAPFCANDSMAKAEPFEGDA